MTALSLWRLERTKGLRVTLVLRHGLKLALQKAETEQKDRIAPKENYIGAFGKQLGTRCRWPLESARRFKGYRRCWPPQVKRKWSMKNGAS